MSTTTTRKTSKKFLGLVELLGEEKAIIAWNSAHPNKPIEGSAPASPLTDKEQQDVLVAQAGLTYTRGRVYVTQDLLEAQAQVFKTGTPTIVKVEGERHTKGVLVTRHATDTVALQNLAAIN